MVNNVFLVGKIASKIEEDGTFEIEVNNLVFIKNKEEQEKAVETVKVKVQVSENFIEAMNENNKIGDVVGLKGALINGKDGLMVYVEKITFLKETEKEDEDEEVGEQD